MRYAKKSQEELLELRRTLVRRLTLEQPDPATATRWIRESLGLSQRDFATLVGLSTPQIARLERGETNPTLETLLAVGKPYGLRVGFCHSDYVVSPDDSDPYTSSLSVPRRSVQLPRLNFDKKQQK